MRLSSFGLELGISCDFLYSVLLWNAILGLDFLGLALSGRRFNWSLWLHGVLAFFAAWLVFVRPYSSEQDLQLELLSLLSLAILANMGGHVRAAQEAG